MSEEQPKLTKIKERFKLIKIDDYVFQIHDIDNDVYLVAEQICNLLNKQQVTIDQLNLAIDDLLSHTSCDEIKKENERLKNKLNVTALELVDEAISMGKAVEISEMNYHEFLKYRQNKGKPMELQKMSEKRFTDISCSETGHIGVTDCGIDKEFTSDEFEDFLNELNDENDILKQQLQTRYIVNKQYEELQRLKKENELLKRKLELESVKRMHYEQKFFQLKAKELGYNE